MGSIPERGRGFTSGDDGRAGLRRPHVEDPEPALELLCEGNRNTAQSCVRGIKDGCIVPLLKGEDISIRVVPPSFRSLVGAEVSAFFAHHGEHAWFSYDVKTLRMELHCGGVLIG